MTAIDDIASYPSLLWLLTWLIHSTALFSAVWLFEHLRPASAPQLLEFLWKLAIVASLVSATVSSLDLPYQTAWRFEVGSSDHSARVPSYPSASVELPIRRNIAQSPMGSTVIQSGERLPAGSGLALPEPSYLMPRVLLSAWAGFVVLLFIKFFATWRRAIRYLGRRTRLPRTHRASQLLEQLRRRAHCRRFLILTVSNTVTSPVSLPASEICLPCWAISKLSDAQLEGLLAHELSHCLRRDPDVLLVLQTLRLALFMQPLLYLATRRLAALAELAADERASHLTGDQRSIAEALAHCVNRLRHAQPAWGVAMTRRTSNLGYRLRRLLHPDSYKFGQPSRCAKFACAIAALLVALVLPTFTTATSVSEDWVASADIHTEPRGTRDEDDLVFQYIDNLLTITVESHGSFALNGTETDVVEVDGYLVIEATEGKHHRKVKFEESIDGAKRRYWIDDHAEDWGSEAQSWLESILPLVMRKTGTNAHGRAARLFRLGGTDRVLDEIELIDSEVSTLAYLDWLVRSHELSSHQYDRLLDVVGRFEGGVATHNAIALMVEWEGVETQRAAKLLDIVSGIGSDKAQRLIIQRLIRKSDIERSSMPQLVELVSEMTSDVECRRTLEAILTLGDPRLGDRAAVIVAAGNAIGSERELREFLESVAQQTAQYPQLGPVFVNAITSIRSSRERRFALSAFAAQANKGTAGWPAAIDAADAIKGDRDRAEALIAIAQNMPMTNENVRRYEQLKPTLESDVQERIEHILSLHGV